MATNPFNLVSAKKTSPFNIPPAKPSVVGILDRALTGGVVGKTINAAQQFASLTPEKRQLVLDVGTGKIKASPSQAIYKNTSLSTAPAEFVEAQKSPEAAAAYEKEQERRKLKYIQQNEGTIAGLQEQGRQWGNAIARESQPIIEFGNIAAQKAEEQGHPILGGIVRGATGLYQTAVGSKAEALNQLSEGNPLGAVFTYGMGKMMTTSPTGMAWTAAMEQKPVKEHVQPVLDAWNNELDTFFAEQKNNPFSPIGSVLKESGKLLPYLLFDKISRIPFKSKKTVTLQDGKTIEIPVDRKWYAEAKKSVFNDILQIANDPAKFFKEKQFGLSIKAVGDEAEKGKMTSLKDMRTKLPRAGIEKPAPLPDYTTRVLDMLGDRKTVSRQFINDLTNRPELRQSERDLIRSKLSEFQGDTIGVPEFAASVRGDLLPLKRLSLKNDSMNGENYQRYENISLPDNLRGAVENYSEHIYQSPIKTSAGDVHFRDVGTEKYFAHTRIEDLPNKKYTDSLKAMDTRSLTPEERANFESGGKGGDTRRIIEVQSDLFQKGRLEQETQHWSVLKGNENLNMLRDRVGQEGVNKMLESRKAEVAKLEPYRNTWYERVIREEVKQASKDGKTKVQFPTGETALKIEGLGEEGHWFARPQGGRPSFTLTKENLSEALGKVVQLASENENMAGVDWVITDILGDGKFKAVPRDLYEGQARSRQPKEALDKWKESFDISGHVDTNNPIYKYYEKDVQKFLKREYPDMKRVKDAQGVEWFEVDTTPKPGQLSYGEKPVFAFKEKPREGDIPEEARARFEASQLNLKDNLQSESVLQQEQAQVPDIFSREDMPMFLQKTDKSQLSANQISAITKQLKVPSSGIIPQLSEMQIERTNSSLHTKVNLLDWFRTPDRVLEKIGLGKEGTKLKKSYNMYLDALPHEINKITSWWERVKEYPDASKKIFQYLDGQEVGLNPKEAKVAVEIKDYLAKWADKLGLPPSNRIANYITHIFDEDFIKKEFDQDLAKLIAEKIPGSVYDPFLQQRLGKLGYIEDAFRALDAYVKRATRKYYMDPALKSLKEAADPLDLDSFRYVQSLAERVNLRPTQIDNYLDNLIKQSFIGYKFGARPTARVSRFLRQTVYRGTLGLNFGSAVRNLSQGANTYAMLGEKYTVLGYMKAIREMVTRGTELERAGVLRDNIIQDRQLSAVKGTLEKLDKGLWIFFNATEKINRGAAYFGAKARAIKRGLSELEATEAGVEAARKTQFSFGSVDTPVALQSDLVKTFTQFQSYNIKQAEFLSEMIRNKQFAGLVRWTSANLLFMATIGSLFGYDIKDMIPFSGVLTGETKLGATPPIQLGSEIMGALMDSPDDYGKPRTAKRKLTDVLTKLKPFVPAGVQLSKTADTVKALLNNGQVKSSSGKTTNFSIRNKSIPNITKGLLFGQYATEEGQKYLNRGKRTKSLFNIPSANGDNPFKLPSANSSGNPFVLPKAR